MAPTVAQTLRIQQTRHSARWRQTQFLQSALLALVVGLSVAQILATVTSGLLGAVFTYLFVAFVGLQQCYSTQRKLADGNLNVLASIWLAKLGLTVFLLYVGWIPQLDPASSPEWGYDPQRYYQDAFDLSLDDWNTLSNLNYQGIIYYYGVIFYLLGHNPLIAALVNVFVTLLATLYLIRAAYEFKGQPGSRDWTLAYLLLIPEVVWYDVLTSRETLSAALLIFSTVAAGRYIVSTSRISFMATLALVGGGLVGILAVRTTMVLPGILAIVLMAVLLTPQGRFDFLQKALLVLLGISMLLAGPWVQSVIGGYDVDVAEIASGLVAFEKNVASEMEWSDRSAGFLLVPNNTLQAIIYTVPRVVLNIVAPLPNVNISLSDLGNGSWFAWQGLMTAITSVLNVLALPYVMAGFAFAYRHRRVRPGLLVLHISFWALFIAIAGGNMIIHERYRVMSSLFFYACAWQGFVSCARGQVRPYAYGWYASLALGGALFVAYKTF